jgi:hypothetical protein
MDAATNTAAGASSHTLTSTETLHQRGLRAPLDRLTIVSGVAWGSSTVEAAIKAEAAVVGSACRHESNDLRAMAGDDDLLSQRQLNAARSGPLRLAGGVLTGRCQRRLTRTDVIR